MFNDEYSITQAALSDFLHFPREGEVYYRIPTEKDWASTTFKIWKAISDEEPTSWEGLYASSIHNPVIRYFHRVISPIIIGRINNNKVNSKELSLLHCTFTPK